MKIIGLEEHFVIPSVLEAWRQLPADEREAEHKDAPNGESIASLLLDLDERRISAMDDVGIDVHVLSLSTPGVQSLSAGEAVLLQKESNDLLAAKVLPIRRSFRE